MQKHKIYYEAIMSKFKIVVPTHTYSDAFFSFDKSGGCHICFIGSNSKSMHSYTVRLLRNMPLISHKHKDEIKQIYFSIGLRQDGYHHRPFRRPHHTISFGGMFGSNYHLSPGEVSLAHHGILFIENIHLLSPNMIKRLVEIMANKSVLLENQSQSKSYQADFKLVVTITPCPCGNYGVQGRPCNCAEKTIKRHQLNLILLEPYLEMII